MPTTTDPDNITVTLSIDDYWRIRQALAESASLHSKARARCSGKNQRSTDVILHHEHILRRLDDVDEKLVAALQATFKEVSSTNA